MMTRNFGKMKCISLPGNISWRWVLVFFIVALGEMLRGFTGVEREAGGLSRVTRKTSGKETVLESSSSVYLCYFYFELNITVFF